MDSKEATDSDRRIAPRLHVSVPVGLEVGGMCAEGQLCDISISGARIERSDLNPDLDSPLSVSFVLAGDAPAFEVPAKVVRTTRGGGFAVQFAQFEPRLEDVLGLLLNRTSAASTLGDVQAKAGCARIRDLARTDLTCVAPDLSVGELAALLGRDALDCIVVTEKQVPLGILTAHDVASARPDAPIRTLLPESLIALEADRSVASVLSAREQLRARYLTVVDEQNHLYGLVSQTELLLFCADLILGPTHR